MNQEKEIMKEEKNKYALNTGLSPNYFTKINV